MSLLKFALKIEYVTSKVLSCLLQVMIVIMILQKFKIKEKQGYHLQVYHYLQFLEYLEKLL